MRFQRGARCLNKKRREVRTFLRNRLRVYFVRKNVTGWHLAIYLAFHFLVFAGIIFKTDGAQPRDAKKIHTIARK